MSRVTLTQSGVVVSGEVVPLYSGSVHYWRLDPADWRTALAETKRLGIRLIDTYIPWAVHEVAPGKLDFGETNPKLDVVSFLRIVRELGLLAIVRPGPHINAELTYFGIPERVVWDPDCQARSPSENPVILPIVPVGFPVPSYASEAFLLESDKWLAAVGERLAPLRYPDGPIVLCQIDNEGTLYFRDGLYDQDYRPEAIDLYRSFLREKYGTQNGLLAAYGRRATTFDRVEPPVIFDAENADDLAWHVDWAEFQEHLIATALARMKAALVRAGLSEIPTFHNMTVGYEATPLSAARIGRAVDLVGLDYYHRANPTDRLMIERRTTELVTRAEGQNQPPFACEMGAGFPPFFFPIPDETDNRFTVMTALAYGLRGFNIYMAVDRDRWIGAPIDSHGRPRPFAEFWRKLTAGLEEVRFHELVRKASVRILMPALKRRLNRALHAFSPATPALFAVLGSGSHESCFEEDFGLGGAVASEVDAFVELFERALTRQGIPYAHVESDAAIAGLRGARWIICPSAGGMEPALWEHLSDASREGTRITVGPRVPSRDGSLRSLASPFDHTGFQLLQGTASHPYFNESDILGLASETVRELSLARYPVTPQSVSATIHEDAQGRARVLFVINPSAAAEQATIDLGARFAATDLLDRSQHETRDRALELWVPARSVRMLKLDPA
jgi:beta-galactosidase